MRTTRQRPRGVTILEVLMAIFVMLIGITGVMALFPVGVQLSQEGADDILSAMTVQNALAAIRVEPGLRNRIKGYVLGQYDDGDVLAWKDGASEGVDGITGTVSVLGSDAWSLEVSWSGVSGRTLAEKDAGGTVPPRSYRALMLLTSGQAAGKICRLDQTTDLASSSLVSEASYTDFSADGVVAGDKFQLIGARDDDGTWATVPAGFYDESDGYQLGSGAAAGYGYLAIVTRRVDNPDTVRIDVLVFKGYDKTLPPEGNLPAVAYYTTYWSMDMLNGGS